MVKRIVDEIDFGVSVLEVLKEKLMLNRGEILFVVIFVVFFGVGFLIRKEGFVLIFFFVLYFFLGKNVILSFFKNFRKF